MQKYLSLLLALTFTLAVKATSESNTANDGVCFDDHFENATMRLDYVMAGNARHQDIYLEHIYRTSEWAGRRARLSEKFLNGNGQLVVRDHKSHEVLYVWTFSTLFQEWLLENEAKELNRAFECSYQIPFPRHKVDVTISLTDSHQKVLTEMTHTIDPTDIQIRTINAPAIPYKYIHKGGEPSKCVDLAILAEGYTEADQDKFYHDCERAVEALFRWEPFRSMKDRFNVVAVAAQSQESAPTIPHDGRWRNTAFRTQYDTFYSARYLTTIDIHNVFDALSGVPFEHIMLLVNSETYGGGGIYNQITFSTSDHPTFAQVFVHEFGHSYGGLGDEYAYDDMDSNWYPADTEPWEPNLTTLKDFQSKWADLMPNGTPIPTPLDPKVPNYKTMDKSDKKAVKRLNAATQVVGVFEGAGYTSKGCYRPAQECRMKINEVEDFCPVCNRAIRRITDFYTAE